MASRYENDELITCEANNPVLEENQEEPQRAEVKLDIQCECHILRKVWDARFPELTPGIVFVVQSRLH